MVGRSESLGEHSIGPGIRKRKRSETPPKEMTSGDEAGYVEEEERAAKRVALHVLVGIHVLPQACLGCAWPSMGLVLVPAVDRAPSARFRIRPKMRSGQPCSESLSQSLSSLVSKF